MVNINPMFPPLPPPVESLPFSVSLRGETEKNEEREGGSDRWRRRQREMTANLLIVPMKIAKGFFLQSDSNRITSLEAKRFTVGDDGDSCHKRQIDLRILLNLLKRMGRDYMNLSGHT